jgi:hypothetical protein
MEYSAVNLGQKLQQVLVATADSAGLPHVAVATGIVQVSEKRLAVSAWFCPGTLKNLEQNRLVSLVVWDPATDEGYQLLGEVEKLEEEAIMNGYSPELEKKGPVPQVKWKITVQVGKVLDFTRAPHGDVEEQAAGPITAQNV